MDDSVLRQRLINLINVIPVGCKLIISHEPPEIDGGGYFAGYTKAPDMSDDHDNRIEYAARELDSILTDLGIIIPGPATEDEPWQS
jgi:hypothetical protein